MFQPFWVWCSRRGPVLPGHISDDVSHGRLGTGGTHFPGNYYNNAVYFEHLSTKQSAIAAISIRAEVTAQSDYIISILEQVELFVQIKLTENDVTLEHTTVSVSRPFIKWMSRKTTQRGMRLPGSCLNPRTYSLRHELNLAQCSNLDRALLYANITEHSMH